ncbi:hypothetical protein GL2_10950 [Microbulbifer sp. GL-2]|nr:hypothetical protein GL2_10950 [Microbulbifer sp. GL-2]
MAWNEPGGKDKDPWGGGGGGNRNNDGPPDLDELFRKVQQKLGGLFGGVVPVQARVIFPGCCLLVSPY